jgi:hypothetical protein
MNGFAILGAKEEVVVVFIEMYDPETIDPRVPRFLFDHSIHYVFPSCEAVRISESIVKHIMMN